jgi:hypothetical protein
MAEKTDTISIGTEAWNVADGYVKLKILKQLVMCDKLEIIALYGTEDIDDTQMNPISPELIPQRRVDAIQRLKDNIIQLIGNVKFAIRKDDDEIFEALRGRIKLVESMLDATCFVAEDQVSHTKELIINEEWFRKMLSEMQEIKESINFPINNAGLIFRKSDEMDFDELLKDVREGG